LLPDHPVDDGRAEALAPGLLCWGAAALSPVQDKQPVWRTRHQTYGSVEDAVIQGVESALLNEQPADFMELEYVVRPIEVFGSLSNRRTQLL
jgi:hypothetical protein